VLLVDVLVAKLESISYLLHKTRLSQCVYLTAGRCRSSGGYLKQIIIAESKFKRYSLVEVLEVVVLVLVVDVLVAELKLVS
jgi:hypothetical protein